MAVAALTILTGPSLLGQQLSYGVDGTISTVAGNNQAGAGYSGDGSAATSAQLNNPVGVAFDSLGNLYIADYNNNVVRKVDTKGNISTVAGDYASGKGYSGDGGLATSAQLYQPSGLAFDAAGNLYIVDNGNNVVRKVDMTGKIITVAGNNALGAGYNGDGGPATSAQLNLPLCIVLDAAGNLYIADTKNSAIRMVNTKGVITTIAGSQKLGGGYSGDGGAATSAQLNYPAGLAVDTAGSLYIADQHNNVIRKVTTNGIIATIAGDGAASYDGDGSLATLAGLDTPLGIALDGTGNVYIADYNNYVVRRVDASGLIMTIAGSHVGSVFPSSNSGPGYWGDGGPATYAGLGLPFGLTFDTQGNIYIADTTNNVIRKVTAPDQGVGILPDTKIGSQSSLTITISNTDQTNPLSFAAIGLDSGTSDFIISTPSSGGCPLNSGFELAGGMSCRISVAFKPMQVGLRTALLGALSNSKNGVGTLPLEGSGLGALGEFDSGVITSYAGNVSLGNGDGSSASSINGSPATLVQLSVPEDTATDPAGNLYIYSYYGGIEKVDTYGFISTVAGGATTVCSTATDSIGDGCPATQAILAGGFAGIALDAAGNIYISDTGEHQRVRKVEARTGIITTVAGNGCLSYGGLIGCYGGDGGPATSAELDFPFGLAVDTKGDLFIAEGNNNDIRKVDTNGIITTVAGNHTLGAGYSGDGGPATSAQLNDPEGLKVDAVGNLYIADVGNSLIRKVNTNGIITTVAGNHTLGAGYSGDGGPATSAQLSLPTGIALDAAGDLYISDDDSGVVRKVDTSEIITTAAGGSSPICSHATDSIGDGCMATQGTFGGISSATLHPGLNIGIFGPNGMSMDAVGNLYVADSPYGVVRKISPGTILDFGAQPVSQSVTQTSHLFNTGNAPLQLASSNLFAMSGVNAADFSVVAGAAQGCEPGAAVAPGSSCTVAVTFTPSAAGSRTAILMASSNALNSAQVTATLEGTGTIVGPTTTALAASATSVVQGNAVALTATVRPSSGAGTPTGSVTFFNGLTSLSSVLINSSGVATYNTNSLPVGTDSVTASYDGDAYFSPSTSSALPVTVGTPGFVLTNSGNISLVPGATAGNTATITLSPIFGFTGAVNLSCTVTAMLGSLSGPPTCTVVSPISLNGAIAPSATTTLTIATSLATTPGSYAVTVTGTDAATGKIIASTGMTVMVLGFGLSTSGNLTVAPGSATGNTSTITVIPAGGFTGSVALTAAVTSSPTGAQYPPSLSFGSTSPVTITGSAAGTATLTITTTAVTAAALAYPKGPGVPWYAAGGASLACIFLLGIPARRRRWLAMLGILFFFVVIAGGVSGCGGSSGSSGVGTGNPGTTAGTYTITVTGTSGTITETGTVTLTVQ